MRITLLQDTHAGTPARPSVRVFLPLHVRLGRHAFPSRAWKRLGFWEGGSRVDSFAYGMSANRSRTTRTWFWFGFNYFTAVIHTDLGVAKTYRNPYDKNTTILHCP